MNIGNILKRAKLKITPLMAVLVVGPGLSSVALSADVVRGSAELKWLHVIAPQSPQDLRGLFRYTGEPVCFVGAHRGGSRPGLPENCIETFKDTLRHTFAIMEIDPRYTRDGEIVVHHDPTLERTTNGKGRVAEMTLRQLKELRLKDCDGHVTEFQIPTLDEVLQWARGRTVLVLDQKDVPIEARVGKIEEHRAEAYTMLIVYNFKDARKCYELNRNIMMEVMIPTREKFQEFDETGVRWSNIIAFVGHTPPQDKELLQMIHAKGACCMAGTSRNLDKELVAADVDEAESIGRQYRALLEQGVDVIETDIPREVGEMLHGGAAIPVSKSSVLQKRPVGAGARVKGSALPGVIGEDRNRQRVLIGAMEAGGSIGSGGWQMKELLVEAAEGVRPKIGRSALAFGGDAEIAGAKGDFKVHGALAGKTEALGVWVYLESGANVDRVGIQVYDAQGEALMMLVPADWSGWKWVEFEMVGEHVRQSYQQADKNGLVDQPLGSQHIVWFAKAAGATRMIVDGMVALVDRGKVSGGEELTVSTVAPDGVEPGQAPAVSVLAVNYTDEPIAIDLGYSFQMDPAFYSDPLPDPVFGSNHAVGLKSWTVADGEVIEEGSLTDGQSWTSAGTDYKTDHFAEAFQYVELDRVRRIMKMTWLSGDANHTWFVDVAVSLNGKKFKPVAGLQDVDHYKKWGWLDYPVKEPFAAKVIRFRYHTGDPQKKVNAIRFPSELGLYDGVGDEAVALPKVGQVLDEGTVKVTVPARSFEMVDLPGRARMEAGACLLGIEAAWPGGRSMDYRHVFTTLESDSSLVSADSRLGLNTAHMPLAPRLRELGIGWVRFENMKWPFVSAEPHKYAFDGSVGPWHVSTDEIFENYRRNGLNILSYMFLTPKWASSAPEGTNDGRVITFPPKDLSLFGEFCFQVAARYGNTKQPDDVLLSNDKKSGLGLVHYYEMWNEPGLNPKPDATWGGWSAPLDEYYKMMRYGAEAVKKADPTAIVTSAGYAGITRDVVDRLRTYKYPDGKCPLDFVEVINVHYYSGQNPPETAREDGNARVTSSTTFVQDLEDLAAWRDKYAPEMPIWMTETGYDSAGPFGTTEAMQAARLPRVVMLCLAFGVDKVFVYRESGSTPSMHACSGLLRDDFGEKPSWFTFGTLVRQFRDVTGKAVRLPHADENIWLLKWDEGGKPLLTAWMVDGKGRLGINLGGCKVTDAFGAESKVRGTEELEVTAYPTYIRDMETSAGWRKLLADYDKQQLELKRRRERARSCRKYLYDFGAAGNVGDYLLEGMKFAFTPVVAADVWDEARGYGFNKPAMSDDMRSWVKSKLDGDGCRLSESMQFRFRVEPGAYRLALGFGPFADSSTVTIGGLKEPLEMVLTKKAGMAEAEIVVTDTAVLSTSHEGYGEIRWLSLVEKID